MWIGYPFLLNSSGFVFLQTDTSCIASIYHADFDLQLWFCVSSPSIHPSIHTSYNLMALYSLVNGAILFCMANVHRSFSQ